MTGPRTLYDKLFDAHVVDTLPDGTAILYIDRHLVHEVTSPQAFERLRAAGCRVRRPDLTLAVPDHNVPTTGRKAPIEEPESALQLATLEDNVSAFGIPYIPLDDARQGIVHVVGPEQGFSLPGLTIVCGDSHTSTHGAFGALAFGIGTSEVEHVLATQTLLQRRARTMRVTCNGRLRPGVSAKDLALAIIARIGTAGAAGHALEFAGEAVEALGMEGRMTLCNLAIEAGARAGLVAPDAVTFDYVRGRPLAPSGAHWEAALEAWRALPSDPDAVFDREIEIDAGAVGPMVTWGTSPEAAMPIDGVVPDPAHALDDAGRGQLQRALDYMGLAPGQRLADVTLDTVFIGSCTNARIEDIREAARVARGRRVAPGLRALVVPGSGLVKRQAEEEGLARLLVEAGFEWRDAGCSMCLGMNPDRLAPGERCASTSNRNFEGRQGPGGRTHLVSPAVAAAAAIAGRFVDPATLEELA